MLKVQGLCKSYGSIQALSDTGLNLEKGQITLLLGPNGAGKTTLMKTLAGVLEPDAGELWYHCKPALLESRLQYQVGWLPDEEPFYSELMVLEQIELACSLKGIERTEAHRWIEEFRLKPVAHRRIGSLSLGYRQRVGLAMALCAQPDLLLLDEPGNGLDPHQFQELENLILSLRHSCMILISTHRIRDCERLADRICLMRHGRIERELQREEWEAGTRDYWFTLRVQSHDTDRTQELLEHHEYQVSREGWKVRLESKEQAIEFLQQLLQNDVLPEWMGQAPPDLNTLFLDLSPNHET